LEAKQILIIRSKQLKAKDSTIRSLMVLDSLHVRSDSLTGQLVKVLEAGNLECSKQYNKLDKKIGRKNNWIKFLLIFGITEGILLYLK
jgi:hypothetical protein